MPHALARWRAAVPCAALILLCCSTTASAAVVRGTPKADRLTGTAAADTLRGGAGSDVLDGRGGDDRIFGDAGPDRITADGGDRVAAGAGTDHIALNADRLSFRVSCGRGPDRLTVSAAAGLPARAVRARTSGCEHVAINDGAALAPTGGLEPTATTGLLDPPLPPLLLPTPTPSLTPTPTPTPDRQPPSVPQGMAWTTITQTSIGLRWDPSTDNRGVTGYRIYRNGTLHGTTTSTSYTVGVLSCGTSYTIALTARDAAGNESSAAHATGTTSTSACSQPTPPSTPSPTPTPSPTLGTGDRFVATNGKDSGSCTSSAPCRTLGRAYGVAVAGDVVVVSAGTYGRQELPSGSKAVTFRASGGVVVRQLISRASNVVFDGFDVDAAGARITNAVFESHGSGATFKNGRIGNVTDEKGALVSGANFTFDNVHFHDVKVSDSAVHNECVYAIVVPGFTVRNSLFTQCATMDLFFTHGTWWNPPPPAYGNVTIENNVFGHSTNIEPGSWHYYGLSIENLGPSTKGAMDGFTVRHNTFETPVSIGANGTATNTRWVGNLGSWPCIAGVTYRHNVGKSCGTTDKAVSPASSTRTSTAPFGWRDPAANDFHLTAGSPAIDAGDPADAPATDKDGNGRNGTPDAGAYEQ